MNAKTSKNRILGLAFVLQFFTSLVSGFLTSGFLPGNSLPSTETIHIDLPAVVANSPILVTNMLGQAITAMGIVFLGAMLFLTLRRTNEKAALVGFGLYILEAAVLACSTFLAFLLLALSQQSGESGAPAFLQTLGDLAFRTRDFGQNLALLPFGIGAIVFYFQLYRSKLVPRVVSAWGLVTVTAVLAATVLTLYGITVPIFVYLPYVPFELFVGLWILIRGTSEPTND